MTYIILNNSRFNSRYNIERVIFNKLEKLVEKIT